MALLIIVAINIKCYQYLDCCIFNPYGYSFSFGPSKFMVTLEKILAEGNTALYFFV